MLSYEFDDAVIHPAAVGNKETSISSRHERLVNTFYWVAAGKAADSLGIKSIDPRITHACDHECPHCWANVYGRHMGLPVFDRIVELSEHTGIRTLQFTGGEPSLNKAMTTMAARAKERGLALILRTHGRRMPLVSDKATGQTWAEAVARHFDEIIVSIDGLASANFAMRPVVSIRKLLQNTAPGAAAEQRRQIAEHQFTQTMAGYRALSAAVGDRKDVVLKINTVVARANVSDLGPFARYLSRMVAAGTIRIDCWDITQVFPSPECSVEEQQAYLISEAEFLDAVLAASAMAPNISKRAKPVTSARCLIVDETGRTYIGGDRVLELGVLGEDPIDRIGARIAAYEAASRLEEQRAQKYLTYAAGTASAAPS